MSLEDDYNTHPHPTPQNMAEDDEIDECWLKTNITVNKTPDDPKWFTVVLNPPS